MPRMPPSGVRISCVTVARKRDLALLAASAASRARAAARSASRRAVTSRPTLCVSGLPRPCPRTATSCHSIQRSPCTVSTASSRRITAPPSRDSRLPDSMTGKRNSLPTRFWRLRPASAEKASLTKVTRPRESRRTMRSPCPSIRLRVRSSLSRRSQMRSFCRSISASSVSMRRRARIPSRMRRMAAASIEPATAVVTNARSPKVPTSASIAISPVHLGRLSRRPSILSQTIIQTRCEMISFYFDCREASPATHELSAIYVLFLLSVNHRRRLRQALGRSHRDR